MPTDPDELCSLVKALPELKCKGGYMGRIADVVAQNATVASHWRTQFAVGKQMRQLEALLGELYAKLPAQPGALRLALGGTGGIRQYFQPPATHAILTQMKELRVSVLYCVCIIARCCCHGL